jgi:biotin carboxylase
MFLPKQAVPEPVVDAARLVVIIAVAVAAVAARLVQPGNISTTPQERLSTRPGVSNPPGFVLLIAPSGSYRIAPYLNAVQALGMQLIVASDSEHSLIPAVAQGITVDFSDISKARLSVLAAIKPLNIVCVLATDDSCVELGSQIARHLDLPHNPITATRLTHRKDLARQALKKAGCNTPAFQIVPIKDSAKIELDFSYPIVLKPLSLSGGRGVIRVNDRAELLQAIDRIDSILDLAGQTGFARQHILLEAYLDGPEFAVEGFLIDAKFHLLTIFDKPEPMVGPYFEETFYLTPSQLDRRHKQALVNEVANCCRAYGLEHGPVHAEARITGSGTVLLELAARTIGGQCGQLIEFSLQQKLEELVIQGMCGNLPKISTDIDAAGVMMIPITSSGLLKRIEGLTDAMQVKFIKDIEIHIREGYELVPLPEGSSYLGFIFAQAPSYQETYSALKTAYEKLRFVTQPSWKLDQLAG